MVKNKKIFLSASSREEDESLVNWFKKIIEDYQLKIIFATDILQPRPPHDKIRDLIRNSSGFVGILTRRQKIEDSNLWKGPDWVQNEIGIAFDCEKPLFIFIENDVDDQGITNRITDYIKFDRKNIEDHEGKVRNAIRELSKLLIDDTEEKGIVIRKLGSPLSDLGLIIKDIGKWYVTKKYAKLNVSLKKEFIIMTLLTIIPGLVICDFIRGSNFLGTYAAGISIVIVFVIFIFLGISMETRCKECGSYYSLVEKPLKTSDVKYLREYILNYDVSRIECEFCGYYEYGYRVKSAEEDD